MRDKNTLRTKPIATNDGFGKLPPQSLELEESVLGAVILERKAIDAVPFLRPEHFYLESHRIIFGACKSMQSEKVPIDMRTIVAELRKLGQLEVVGGAYYVAELTSKVSSGANVEYHSRVILEHYIKRQVIQLSGALQHDAYEDTSNALELLDRSLADLKSLQQNSVVRTEESIIKEQWLDRHVKEKPPEEKILIRIDGSEMCSPGNHSLVTGQKKSRKSLFVVHELGLFFQQNKGAAGGEVCIFDTEQGKWHVWKYYDRIKRLTGKDATMFRLRGMGYKERRDFIQHTIQFWPNDKIKIIVIDGIRDLVSNINDPDECTELIEWLEALILRHDVHVINVLHLNKTDGNARGHLGSELQNKAEASIKVELDKETGHSIVSCESSREKGFDDFAFHHSQTGLPELVDLPSSGTKLNEDERRNRLAVIFSDGGIKYGALLASVEDHFAVSQRKGRQLISEFMRNGWIVKSGPDRSPNTIYKLMVSENGHGSKEDVAQLKIGPVDDPGADLPF